MSNLKNNPEMEIYICDPYGVRFLCLDYVTELSYTRINNDIAPAELKLPASKFDWNSNRLDNIIEIIRWGRLDYLGFLRNWTYQIEGGIPYWLLSCVSPIELLSRRHVASYTGAAGADITDEADDMLKTIVYNEMGAGASASRNLTSVGGGFTIQQNNSEAPSISKQFAHKNLLDICKEIAAASSQAGTPLYFDIRPIPTSVTNGAFGFQFFTKINQLSNDRTEDSSAPIFIGSDWGNMEDCNIEYDYLDEINSVTAKGRGSGASEQTIPVTSTERAEKSIWNLREGIVNTDAEYGDTAHLTGDANTYLDENKPKRKFSGNIIDNYYFRYGRDYYFGDKVTVSEAGQQFDANIDKLEISVDNNGNETRTIKLIEVE